MERAHGSSRHVNRSISIRVSESRWPTDHQAPTKAITTARRGPRSILLRELPAVDSKLRRDGYPEAVAGADVQARQQQRSGPRRTIAGVACHAQHMFKEQERAWPTAEQGRALPTAGGKSIASSMQKRAWRTAVKKNVQGRLAAAIRPQGSSFKKGRSQDMVRDVTRTRPCEERNHSTRETWKNQLQLCFDLHKDALRGSQNSSRHETLCDTTQNDDYGFSDSTWTDSLQPAIVVQKGQETVEM